MTTVCCLSTAIIYQERLSPLAAASSLVSTVQHTTGVTVARSHHRPAPSWLSPGLPGHLLLSWCFPTAGNYYSQKRCEYESKIHILILFYSTEKGPFKIFFWTILNTFCGIIRSSQEILVFPSLKRLLTILLNYFPIQE